MQCTRNNIPDLRGQLMSGPFFFRYIIPAVIYEISPYFDMQFCAELVLRKIQSAAVTQFLHLLHSRSASASTLFSVLYNGYLFSRRFPGCCGICSASIFHTVRTVYSIWCLCMAGAHRLDSKSWLCAFFQLFFKIRQRYNAILCSIDGCKRI